MSRLRSRSISKWPVFELGTRSLVFVPSPERTAQREVGQRTGTQMRPKSPYTRRAPLAANEVNVTKRRVVVGTSLGLAVGSLAGLFLFLSGFLAGVDVLLVVTRLAALVLLSGFTGGVVSSFMRYRVPGEGAGLPQQVGLHVLSVPLSASGLALTILGGAVSFVCGPDGSCASHPYRFWGLIVVASGIPLFLAGLVLATSSSSRRLQNTLQQKGSSVRSGAARSPAASPRDEEPAIREPQPSADHESRRTAPPRWPE